MSIQKRRSQMEMSSSDIADVYANWPARVARIASEVAGVTVEQVAEVLTWAASTVEGRALTAELDTIETESRVAA